VGLVFAFLISIQVAIQKTISVIHEPFSILAVDAWRQMLRLISRLNFRNNETNNLADELEVGQCPCEVSFMNQSLWSTANAMWVAVVGAVTGIVWYMKTRELTKERTKLKQMAVEVAMEFVQNQCKLAQKEQGGVGRAVMKKDDPWAPLGRTSVGEMSGFLHIPKPIVPREWDAMLPD